MPSYQLFRKIEKAYTFEGVEKKQGRSPREEDLGEIRRAAFLVDPRGHVAWMGPERSLTAGMVRKICGQRAPKEIVLDAGLVLPGFTDCHTHLVFGGDRSQEFEWRIQGATYQEIAARGGGIRSTVQATRDVSRAELRKRAQGFADELIRQGVTAVEVKSGYGLDLVTERKILSVARELEGVDVVTTFLGLHALPPEAKERKDYVRLMVDEVLVALHKNGLVDRVDAFVEQGYFDLEDAELLIKRATELGLAFCLHADQLTRTGSGVWGASRGAHSVDHVVQVSAVDVRSMAPSSTVAVLLPAADFYLKMAYPPARALIDTGMRVALATDFNPGTSPTQDLNFVGLLARLEMKMSLPEVLVAWIHNSAVSLGHNQRGSLLEGKRADFVCMDADLSELFYRVGHWPVQQVWRSGRKMPMPRPRK